jgi:hypothetical protein
MAKAWIDANEREGVVTRPAPAAPVDKGRDAPVAKAAAPTRPEPVRGAPARPAPPRTPPGADWAGLCRAVGLDSDEKIERLSRLLVVQFLLDRLVAVTLAGKLASSSESGAGRDVGTVLADIAPLPLPARIDLASRLGVIAPAVAESIVEADRLRDRLLHGKPPGGRPGWDVSTPQEIASADAGDRCLHRGIEAAQGLIAALGARPTPA